MTCSWASRLISLVVDDSDDKTTTFTPLLFNFYLFPQASLSITDFSQLLSVFLSVHLSFLLLLFSPLYPWCFQSFHPASSWINNLFLISLCVFYASLHFSSLFVPFQFPRGLLSFSPVLRNQYFSIRVHSSLSYFTPQPSVPVSSSLSLLVSTSPLLYPHLPSFGILHALLLILTSPLMYSSSISFFFFLFFTFFSSSGWESFCFLCFDIFPLLECCGSHTEWSFPHQSFKSLNFFFFSPCPLVKWRYRALGRVRRRERTDLFQSRDRDNVKFPSHSGRW